MKGSTLIFRVAGIAPEVKVWDGVTPDLKFLQTAVGGYIEMIPYFNTIFLDESMRDCDVYCDEEGKLNGKPFNRVATLAWHEALLRIRDPEGNQLFPRGLRNPDGSTADILVGDIVVVTGDAEFLKRYREGEDE